MSKYLSISNESLIKLGDCFSSTDEFKTFISQLDDMAREIGFSSQMLKRICSDQVVYILLRQVCEFTIFCREHMELIHELVKSLDCKEITEEEANERRLKPFKFK